MLTETAPSKPAVSAACLIGFLALGLITPAHALERLDVNLRGFGTLGMAHNREDGAGFIRDITQPTGVKGGYSGHLDSRAGLQLDVSLPPKLSATLQVVTRYRYDGRYKPEIAWGFVKYSPTTNLDLRVGRLGWDVYMLSDSRDVGYSYLWVRPPVDYYGVLQFSKLNGADLVASTPIGNGLLTAKLFAGSAVGNLALNKTFYVDTSDTDLVGGYLNYEQGSWQFRLGYTDINVDNTIKSRGANALPLLPQESLSGNYLDAANKSEVKFWSAGATYDRGPLQGQLMFTYSENGRVVPAWRSGYVSFGYRLGAWTPFVTYAVNKATSQPSAATLPAMPLPEELPFALANHAGAASPDQSTFSFGVRYDLLANMALKLQYDHVNVRRAGRQMVLWRDAEPNWNGRARVFSATLDFVF